MPDTIHCPDCGYQNPAGSVSCWKCNFPLVAVDHAASDSPSDPGEAAVPAITRESVRPLRARRPREGQPIQSQLWLVFGALAALIVIGVAIRGFSQNNSPQPVEGAKVDQTAAVNAMRERLAKDSTDVEARIQLADVLYDTANWSDAIVHYTAANRLDPKRAATVVDLGVCYFNLGETPRADSLFRSALELDPHLPQALFNLGIIAEHREDWSEALNFYHRAMQSSPAEPMQKPLMDAMQRVMEKTGSKAPALPGVDGK